MSIFAELFIGVDPGVNGAVAVIDEHRNVVLLESMPSVKIEKVASKKTWKSKDGGTREVTSRSRTELDFPGVSSLMGRLIDLPGLKAATIERVSAMPRDSGISAFTFGGAFWAIQQAFADHGLFYTLIPPREWQMAALGTPEKDPAERRNQYLAKARELFPGADLALKKDADKAAALLLADFLRSKIIYLRDHPVSSEDVIAPEIE